MGIIWQSMMQILISSDWMKTKFIQLLKYDLICKQVLHYILKININFEYNMINFKYKVNIAFFQTVLSEALEGCQVTIVLFKFKG